MLYVYSPENTPWIDSPHLHSGPNGWWIDDDAPEDIKESFNSFVEDDRKWREYEREAQEKHLEQLRKDVAEGRAPDVLEKARAITRAIQASVDYKNLMDGVRE